MTNDRKIIINIHLKDEDLEFHEKIKKDQNLKDNTSVITWVYGQYRQIIGENYNYMDPKKIHEIVQERDLYKKRLDEIEARQQEREKELLEVNEKLDKLFIELDNIRKKK